MTVDVQLQAHQSHLTNVIIGLHGHQFVTASKFKVGHVTLTMTL